MYVTFVLCDNIKEASNMYEYFKDLMDEWDSCFIVGYDDGSLSVDDYSGNRTTFIDEHFFINDELYGIYPDEIVQAVDLQNTLDDIIDQLFEYKDIVGVMRPCKTRSRLEKQLLP